MNELIGELINSSLFGAVLGAVGTWVTTYYFPLKLKRKEWKYEKEVWAKEFILEHISLIYFLSDEYFKGEEEDNISASGLSMQGTSNEIFKAFSLLLRNAHKLELYADENLLNVLRVFLSEVAQNYSGAKETWGMWDQDDEISETLHTESTIRQMRSLAKDSVEKLKQDCGL